MEAETVYGEGGVDSGFLEVWEDAQEAVAGVNAAAWSFVEPEPWLTVINLQSNPTLMWRVTTVEPIDYDTYQEWPAD